MTSPTTATMLADVPVDRIQQIVGKLVDDPLSNVYLTDREDIAAFQAANNEEVDWLDGVWCSSKPINQWLNFHVELKH